MFVCVFVFFQNHVEPGQRPERTGGSQDGDHALSGQRQHLHLAAAGAQEVCPGGGAQAQVQPVQTDGRGRPPGASR